MALILDGTNGLSDVDGSAATPAIRGTDTNTGIFFPAADTIAFSEGGVESMRIDSSGNLSVGTNSPLIPGKISVAGAYFGTGEIASHDSSRQLIRMSMASGVARLDATFFSGAGGGYIPLAFSTSDTERMRIDTAGNVGIGTSSPSAKFEVSASFANSAIEEIARVSRTGGTTAYASNRAAALTFFDTPNSTLTAAISGIRDIPVGNFRGSLGFYTTNGDTQSSTVSQLAERMRIDSSGNVGIGNTSMASFFSDVRQLVVGSGTGGQGITVYSGNASYGYLAFNDAATTTVQGWVGYNHNGDSLAFATNAAERMRITSAGNVGIGTSSPNTPLDIRGTSTTTINLLSLVNTSSASNTTKSSALTYYLADTAGTVKTSGRIRSVAGQVNIFGAPMVFETINENTGNDNDLVERMRIDSSGNLLVGTTSNGLAGYVVGKSIIQNNDYSVALAYSLNSTSSTGIQYFIAFGRGNSACGLISSTGTNSTTYATSSDYRLKENIKPMTGALDKVAQLKPCTYTWKADGSSGQGFIAHELQEVIPDAVVGEKDAVNEDGSIKPQGIDTSFLVATLTAAIQELNAKVDALQTELNTLKGV